MRQETAIRQAVAEPLVDERRQFARIRKEVRVACRVLTTSGGVIEGMTRNLSVGGLLISTGRAVPRGAMLLFTIFIPAEGLKFRFAGRVAWSEESPSGEYQTGICFVSMDSDQRQNVLHLIGQGEVVEERRRHIRLPRRLLADYRPGSLLSRWRAGYTRDISMGGLLMHVGEVLAPSDALALRVHLDDAEGKALSAHGVVIDSRPSKELPAMRQMSVYFKELDEATRERLTEYISGVLTVLPIGYQDTVEDGARG